MIITVDGPAASGKSTIGKQLAKKLDIYYLNSGLLYRALAYLLLNECGYQKEQLAHPVVDDIETLLDSERFTYFYDKNSGAKVLFDNQDITPFLKTSFIDSGASIVSAHPVVRKKIQTFEHNLAQQFDMVVEGRDSGTEVFPQADFKFYLTADLPIRAQRWQKSQLHKGNKFTLEQAQKIVSERDNRDKNRKVAPLAIPEGALIINNSNLSIDQTLQELLDIITKK